MCKYKADKASYRNRGGLVQKIISWMYQKLYFNKYGYDNVIKKTAEFCLTDNAILEIGSNCTIQDYAFFQLTKPKPHLTIGDNVTIGRHNMITVKSRMSIGSNTIIGGYVQIIDHNHQFKKSTIIRLQQAEIQHTTIGEDCWIGAGAKILCGVTIEKGVVIGANAVVTHDIPAYSIVAGVPAKIIGDRG